VSRWNPLTPEESRARRLAAKARYRAKPGVMEKEREHRKAYLARPEIVEKRYLRNLSRNNRLHLSVPYQDRVASRVKFKLDVVRTMQLFPDLCLTYKQAKSKISSIKSRFNISSDHFFSLVEQGCWAGSNGLEDECSGALCIDHDHRCCEAPGESCGKCVRGALCHWHNQRLGMYEKHKAWAEKYLGNQIRREA